MKTALEDAAEIAAEHIRHDAVKEIALRDAIHAAIIRGSNAELERKREAEERTISAYQNRVWNWFLQCFPAVRFRDKRERAFRFIEEALELVQTQGVTPDECKRLVDYVYSRPVGEACQEVGGVFVTLSSLCRNAELDLQNCAALELDRILKPEVIERIRQKQVSKELFMEVPS